VQTESPAQNRPPVGTPELSVPPALPVRKLQPAVPAPRAARPEGSAISRAVTEVTQIVESLRQTIERMEEVLELVELAERQKLGDEAEIESLLRALRQLQSHGGRTERRERNG
jgi:acyl-CoA reductase-like NAD-dependent aldehyde dehydrogenase